VRRRVRGFKKRSKRGAKANPSGYRRGVCHAKGCGFEKKKKGDRQGNEVRASPEPDVERRGSQKNQTMEGGRGEKKPEMKTKSEKRKVWERRGEYNQHKGN